MKSGMVKNDLKDMELTHDAISPPNGYSSVISNKCENMGEYHIRK
jgi:hypothetical protein